MGVSYSVKKQTVWIDASKNEACVQRQRSAVGPSSADGEHVGGIEAQLATIRLSCPTSVVVPPSASGSVTISPT
jgi:hypothetical protein